MNEQRVGIDWRQFESKYWRPEEGETNYVTLANWGMTQKSYDEGKTERAVMVFDVIKVDNRDLSPPKIFETSAVSFAEQIRPIIERAEARGEKKVTIYMEFTKEKKYRIMDMNKVRNYIREGGEDE